MSSRSRGATPVVEWNLVRRSLSVGCEARADPLLPSHPPLPPSPLARWRVEDALCLMGYLLERGQPRGVRALRTPPMGLRSGVLNTQVTHHRSSGQVEIVRTNHRVIALAIPNR